jgi:hypothetical protein
VETECFVRQPRVTADSMPRGNLAAVCDVRQVVSKLEFAAFQVLPTKIL